MLRFHQQPQATNSLSVTGSMVLQEISVSVPPLQPTSSMLLELVRSKVFVSLQEHPMAMSSLLTPLVMLDGLQQLEEVVELDG